MDRVHCRRRSAAPVADRIHLRFAGGRRGSGSDRGFGPTAGFHPSCASERQVATTPDHLRFVVVPFGGAGDSAIDLQSAVARRTGAAPSQIDRDDRGQLITRRRRVSKRRNRSRTRLPFQGGGHGAHLSQLQNAASPQLLDVQRTSMHAADLRS